MAKAPLILIAAGGTGGAYVPGAGLGRGAAGARLAGSNWSTDARGARYAGGFPDAVRIDTVSAATFARGGVGREDKGAVQAGVWRAGRERLAWF